MQPLFAMEEALAGGGIVGGCVTVAYALYAIWEKASKRQTEVRRERLADREQKIKLDRMARESLSEAHAEELAARKAAHDSDIKSIRRRLRRYQKRLTAMETREQLCQDKCAGLERQNAEQAAEMAELRDTIRNLERKLKATGALPPGGSDLHSNLKQPAAPPPPTPPKKRGQP